MDMANDFKLQSSSKFKTMGRKQSLGWRKVLYWIRSKNMLNAEDYEFF